MQQGGFPKTCRNWVASVNDDWNACTSSNNNLLAITRDQIPTHSYLARLSNDLML